MPFDMSAKQLWEAVLGRLQVQVTRPAFDTWLQGTSGIALTDRRLLVGVPTSFAAECLERRMYQLIDSAVATVARTPLEVVFEVGQPHASSPRAEPLPATPRPERPAANPAACAVNARHTFDSFVVSGSNRLAHAAAMSVADWPGGQFNPLFIYSGVGLGKTHLLQAIATRARDKGATVLYTSTEQFTDDFITTIRERGKTAEFRNRYRQVDVLLVDDVQFISGKEQTQEGFLNTFNSLHSAGRQVVIASDRPPASVPLLSDRLRSRFEGGLMADIQQPELEARVAILQRLAHEAPSTVPDVVVSYLAHRFPSNIRQLQGSFTRVAAMAQFTGVPITLELAEQVLGQDPPPPPARAKATPAEVLALVSRHYRLDPQLVTGTSRERQVAHARQVAIHLLTTALGLSPVAVGSALGGKDPATIRYSLQKVASLLSSSPPFKAEVDYLVHLLSPNT